MRKTIAILGGLYLLSNVASAQVIDRLGRKLNQKLEQKAERAIDKGIERLENGKKKDDKGTDRSNPSQSPSQSSAGTNQSTPNSVTSKSIDVAAPDSEQTEFFKAQSKFDFVSGEKVIFFDDFSTTSVGDFPEGWNTDASAEVKTIDGVEGKWLHLTNKGVFVPELIETLPDNATLEVDVLFSPKYDNASSELDISLGEWETPNDFLKWMQWGRKDGRTGMYFWLHPEGVARGKGGRSKIGVIQDKKVIVTNDAGSIPTVNTSDKNRVRVSIWKQKQRLRVYVGEQKVWDLPRAFLADAKLSPTFSIGSYRPDYGDVFLSNIKIAIGLPDTRAKLTQSGSYTTTGIHFASNSAKIVPESHGAIKEIASVLTEIQDLKVEIIGHTDNTGSSERNKTLSEERAEAVKEYLVSIFGIPAERLLTSGKGDTVPISDNSSAVGRAQNRRVEFIKQ